MCKILLLVGFRKESRALVTQEMQAVSLPMECPFTLGMEYGQLLI